MLWHLAHTIGLNEWEVCSDDRDGRLLLSQLCGLGGARRANRHEALEVLLPMLGMDVDNAGIMACECDGPFSPQLCVLLCMYVL